MTEICRGKNTDNNECYGDVMKSTREEDKVWILHSNEFVSVIPKTIGWSDGTKDMYGKRIYEGNFLKDRNGTLWFAVMGKRSRRLGFIDAKSPELYSIFGNVKTSFLEIVGNLYDTPELLKEGEEE